MAHSAAGTHLKPALCIVPANVAAIFAANTCTLFPPEIFACLHVQLVVIDEHCAKANLLTRQFVCLCQ